MNEVGLESLCIVASSTEQLPVCGDMLDLLTKLYDKEANRIA
jgi:hypothetical protein